MRVTCRSTGPLAFAGSPICSHTATRLSARGQRDVEQLRGAARILKKQLVKIAHAIKQQQVGMLGFDPQVLLHHGRMGCPGGVIHDIGSVA
jgi:hypothetical protein